MKGAPRTERFEVGVVGAGPAGATVARLLAALGRSVVLFHAEARARGPDVESLPPSALPLVEALGLLEAVRAASIAPMSGTVVAWAGEPVETALDPSCLQISRARLDPALRFAAVSAGAVLREARVRSKDPLDDRALGCDVVVDATGRRSGARERFDAWRTLAITGTWIDADDDPRTWTEATDAGWVWSVPAGRRRRQVTAMVDPPKGRGRPGAGLARRHEAEVGRAGWTASRLGGARLESVGAVEVTPSVARTIVSARGLRVGDAAAAVDPLSSFGLKQAFESARLAAVVVHTMLERPACAEDARATYREAVETAVAGAMSGAASEIARAGRSGLFFARRTFASPRPRTPLAEVAAPARDARFVLAPGARIETRAVEEGWLFEPRPVVVSDRFPRGLRWVTGIAAADVARAAIADRVPEPWRAALTSLAALGVIVPVTRG